MYNWKRFWYINAESIRFDYGGFLEDPESEYGHNPDVVPFNSISHIPCLVLLGEPGIGKTTAITQAFSELEQELETSEDDCLFFNLGKPRLEKYLDDDLFSNQNVIKWINGNHKLHLFLDSLDEGSLSINELPLILKDEIDNLYNQANENYFNVKTTIYLLIVKILEIKLFNIAIFNLLLSKCNSINTPEERLFFRIVCRTSVWEESSSLEDKLKEKWEENNIKIYQLAPLRRVDIIEAAHTEGIDTELFMQGILDKEATPLAINPITLKFLTDTYLKNGTFPDSKKELYKQGLLQLCEENNPDRRAARHRGSLNSDQRLIIAGRIASILLLARKTAIWTSTEMVDMPESDIAILHLCVGKETINQQEFLVTENYIRDEVLSITGLFSSRGSNRMGFAHQTYAEFLAAWYLSERNIPLVQVMSLIVSQGDPESKLIPQLHETAAWLASMRPDCLEEIIKTDPDVLLRSDIPTNGEIKEKIVDRLLKYYNDGKLLNRDLGNYFKYKKLKHPRLAEQLRAYIQDSNNSLEARDEAIDIAKICEVDDLQEDLVNLALDSSQSIHLRVNAANALCSIGNSETKLKLKPLAIGNLEEDKDDRLKGYSLEAVWPEHLTAEELFNAITPPKRANFFGGYQSFIDKKLASKLHPSDLLLALQWLEKQGLRVFGNSFEKIGNEILLKAWENIDIPGIAKAFSKIALIQWQEYQKLITQRDYSQYDFQSELLQDDNKRRILLENLVLEITEQNKDSDIIHPLTDFTEQVILSQDLFWMLDKLQNTELQKVQKIWVQLIEWSFNRQDAKQIDAIITATQTNEILRNHFISYFEPIELNSSQADKMKASYQRMGSLQKGQKEELPLKPIPKERVISCLENLENTDRLDWWLQLNLEMTLLPQSKYYGNELEHDLTEIPGWKEADQTIKQRIINGAEKYILEQNEIDYIWIGTNTFDRLALSGCRAIYLLLKESPNSLDILTDEIWQKWTPVIVSYPNLGRVDNNYYDLVGIAYKKAPNKTIETLLILINKENQQYNDVFIIDKFSKCWDEYFKSIILREINNNQSLKPNTIEKLLRELLKYGYQPAKEFVKSLISNPLPIEQEEYQKIVLATGILIENADSDDWLLIWSMIQQDTKFGRNVFEAIANRHSFGINLNITEVQLADLYIWMIQQYPPNEDPVCEGVHQITNREQISDFRNSILTQLKERGTSRSCLEIQRISKELPELTWMNRVLVEAQIIRRRKEWNPPKPSEIFELISNTEKRFVQDGNELLNVLIESLKKLDIELQDQNPSVIDLWNEIPWKKVRNLGKSLLKKLQEEQVIDKFANIDSLTQVHHNKIKGTTYIPKDENSLSDYVARYLKNNIKNRGIILNREVEIRPLQGGSKGERTDIQVDAIIKKPKEEVLKQITVIIEVKGCWNEELNTSMKEQLVNRYLKDNTCQNGIYLVGWFNCNQWDKSDSNKAKAPKITIDEAREKFEKQAEELSQSGVKVKAFILNTALR
ncbi:hypothetical protein B6N60_04923 [Richelia sinica FACHB-800]|uniref:Uncharacterized protein n=1 Tax=Richelia sinica FACHB-800 TaxID=1357546 RepID=A0A975TDL8_9NOST|nr:hypothetical protein [Richelia sinica]MBD2666924.1 hypothetical protein [Richelia sinica FACHB-800]QXE26192.1 hypothetical protein B6N60_04923 [Richelia sinica FACHB-800]